MDKSPEDEARDANSAQRRYISENFIGDNLFVGLATDEPAVSSKPTLGQRVEQERRRERHLARQAEAREVNATAAKGEAKRRAYERVQDNIAAGRSSSPQDEDLAAQHALETGKVEPKSTMDKLIEQGQARSVRDFEPMDGDVA